eukprot:CAMPEP_0198596636 /NCGR_PEP_ID=MMETSP1462-20131121/143423_1 /TAXON_ID=1333877 /ORGANISM="Brandtodinium nutriculum, Strain RCC3387" /LENGTH=138 /DNA_ID=CAMNT_0044328279 /DNA_START=1 /DNA_END=417 /DNA_ORIENTATION=-
MRPEHRLGAAGRCAFGRARIATAGNAFHLLHKGPVVRGVAKALDDRNVRNDDHRVSVVIAPCQVMCWRVCARNVRRQDQHILVQQRIPACSETADELPMPKRAELLDVPGRSARAAGDQDVALHVTPLRQLENALVRP